MFAFDLEQGPLLRATLLQLAEDEHVFLLTMHHIVSDLPLSYFIEWRVVSLSTRQDGSLKDRGGRFEDAFVNWAINDDFTFRLEFLN